MLRLLCDGCFCLSVILFGVSGLRFCAQAGAFDMLFYSVGLMLGKNRGVPFYKYCQNKHKRRKNKYLLLCGCGLAVLAAVFLVLEKGVY